MTGAAEPGASQNPIAPRASAADARIIPCEATDGRGSGSRFGAGFEHRRILDRVSTVSFFRYPTDSVSGCASTRKSFRRSFSAESCRRHGPDRGLRVISQTTAMQYKDAHRPLPQIAKELNVDAVVEGSVARSGVTRTWRERLACRQCLKGRSRKKQRRVDLSRRGPVFLPGPPHSCDPSGPVSTQAS